jgi:DNA polymerase/3'-5' exonuclease PolX
MSKGKRAPLGLALDLGRKLVHVLKPSCEKIEIAGSVRRECQLVGDLEIVALVRDHELKDLFGNRLSVGRTYLDDALDQLDEIEHLGWTPMKNKQGAKLKRLRHVHTGLVCDLFLVYDWRAWGSHLVVRTGPHPFSIEVMKRAGAMGMFFADGFLLHNHMPHRTGSKKKCNCGPDCDRIIALPTEAAVFENLKIKYLSPIEREAKHGIDR